MIATRAESDTSLCPMGAKIAPPSPRSQRSGWKAPDSGRPGVQLHAPAFRVEASGNTTADLVTSIVTTLAEMYRSEGRFASVAACHSVVTVEEGGTLPPGIACVLVCEGGHVDSRHDPGLRRIFPAEDGAGVWEENGILRARFHLTVEDE